MRKVTLDSEHIYRVDNKKVPGVSQLLVEVGLIDLNVIKFADPSLGTAVHIATELDDKGILDYGSCHEKVLSRLNNWKMFKKDNNVEILHSETSLYSRLGFCGTFDRIIKVEDMSILLDIKTSAVRSKSTRVQMAFYQRLAEENLELNIDEVWEVALLEDKYEIIKFRDLTKEEGIMKSILNIHYYKERK